MSKVIINYDIEGKTIHEDNEDKVFAKSIINDDNEQYFVKRAKSGIDSSHLFNPNSMWFTEGTEGGYNKRTGRKVYELTKATKNCFDFYIRFLQTKNPAYLRNAEREIQ